MYQSVMAKRVTTGSSGTGFAFAVVRVKEVHAERDLCLVEDMNTGNQQDLAISKRGETAWPKVGDMWVIDRSMGHWMLQCKITNPVPPEMTGVYSTMDADVLRLVTLLSGLGLITDATTAGTLPVVTGSRNVISPTVQTILNILDARGILDNQTTAETYPIGVWQTPAYTSAWADYGSVYQPVRYTRDRTDHVLIEGLCKTVSNVSGNSTIFTLPVGYRPTAHRVFGSYQGSGAVRQLQVNSTGEVMIANIGATAIAIPFAQLELSFSVT